MCVCGHLKLMSTLNNITKTALLRPHDGFTDSNLAIFFLLQWPVKPFSKICVQRKFTIDSEFSVSRATYQMTHFKQNFFRRNIILFKSYFQGTHRERINFCNKFFKCSSIMILNVRTFKRLLNEIYITISISDYILFPYNVMMNVFHSW